MFVNIAERLFDRRSGKGFLEHDCENKGIVRLIVGQGEKSMFVLSMFCRNSNRQADSSPREKNIYLLCLKMFAEAQKQGEGSHRISIARGIDSTDNIDYYSTTSKVCIFTSPKIGGGKMQTFDVVL